MVKILLHRILSIRRIPILIRDSLAHQDPLPRALSLSSQDRMVQLRVLAVLSRDNKDMPIQGQGSGLAWELEEY